MHYRFWVAFYCASCIPKGFENFEGMMGVINEVNETCNEPDRKEEQETIQEKEPNIEVISNNKNLEKKGLLSSDTQIDSLIKDYKANQPERSKAHVRIDERLNEILNRICSNRYDKELNKTLLINIAVKSFIEEHKEEIKRILRKNEKSISKIIG